MSKTINTEGYILVGCTLIRNITGVNGNGTLTTIEFRAEKEGSCTLNLYGTKLVSSLKQLTVPADFDSTVTITKTNITVTNVSLSKTVLGQGYSMNITVTVENQGAYTESFNVTVFYDETAITLPNGKNHTTITLTSGNSTTITITWNTTGVPLGTYVISAEASQVPGETDTDDNTLIDGTVYVYQPRGGHGEPPLLK